MPYRRRFGPTAPRGGTPTGAPSGYSIRGRALQPGPQSLGGGLGLELPGLKNFLPTATQRQNQLRSSAGAKIGSFAGDKDLQFLAKQGQLDPTEQFVAALQKDPQGTLERYNLTPEELRAMMPILREAASRGHPHTGLQIAGKILQAPTASIAGFLHGVDADKKHGGGVGLLDVIRGDEPIGKLAPWNFAYAVGHGFQEVPHAVQEGYTYENLIKDSSNPHSFLYRHAMPIGLTLSVVADPTMYIGLGSTSSARLAATRLWAEGTEDAARVASRRAMKGRLINPATQKPYAADEWEQAVYDVATELGKPMTMGDALKQVREAGFQAKAIARAGGGRQQRLLAIGRTEPEYMKKLAGRKIRGPISNRIEQIAAYPLAYNVKGGRGVRIAGRELPGTPQAGEFLGKQARRLGGKAAEKSGLYRGLGGGLVPGYAQRHIVHDWLRTAAGVEMTRFADIQQAGGRTFEQELRKLVNRPVVTGTTEASREAVHPLLGIPRNPYYQKPTAEQMKMEPWRAHFSFFHNKDTGQTIFSPAGSGHDDIYDPLFQNHPDLYTEMTRPGTPWLAGTGHFDHETGKIAAANMNLYEDVAEESGNISERVASGLHADRMKDKVMRQARREYKAGEHPPETVTEKTTTELGKILDPKERKGILKPEPYSWQTEEQKLVKANIEQAVKEAKSKAMARNKDELELERSWDDWKKQTDDPLLAGARFITDLEIKYQQADFINHMVADMRFSYPLRNKAADKHLPLNPKEGYAMFEHRGKKYAVLSPVADALEEFKNPQVINKYTNAMMKAMNYPQNWWKIYATAPNPSFHVMNLLGAIWNNLLMGIYNPGDYVHALGTLYRSHLEQAAQADQTTLLAPIKRLRGQAPESTPLQRESLRIAGPEGEAGIRRGLGRSSFIWSDTESLKEHTTPVGQRGIVAKAFKPSPLDEEKRLGKTRFAARRVRQVGAGIGAPFTGGASLVLTAPEAARIGRSVGGTIEDMVRLTAFQKAARDPAIQRALEAFGPIRVPGFIEAGTHPGFSKREQSIMYDIGAAHARHYQFDYTELTDFERRWAKTIFPFYTYYRKNFVLQATEAIKQPRKLASALALSNYIGEQGDYGDLPDGFKAILPEYFDNLAAFQTPVPAGIRKKLGLPEKMPLFINPKLPFVALNLFPPLWQAFDDPATPDAQKWSGIFSPLMGSWGPLAGPIPGSKVALEAMIDYQLGLNRPIDFQRANSNDWRKSSVPAPGYTKFLPDFFQDWMGVFKNKAGEKRMWATNKYIADQLATPFVANWGAAIPTTTGDPEADAKAKADLLSWMTGVRWLPADMHKFYKNYSYRLKNMLEARQSELREQGKELDSEDKELLHDARAAIKVAGRVEDRRQRELFPKHKGGGTGAGPIIGGGSTGIPVVPGGQLNLGPPPAPSQSGYELRR